MHISVDGGALCGGRMNCYGTCRFTKEFLHALSLYDKKNIHTIYTYCDIDDSVIYPSLRYKKIRPEWGWMKIQVSRYELLEQNDIFLGINQALPWYTPARKIVICRGLSFYFYKDCYTGQYKRLMSQLYTYARYADDIIVSSVRVRDELQNMPFPIKGKIHVLPFGIPFHYEEYTPQKRERFFLYVGSGQKIKNLDILIRVFHRFSSLKEGKDMRLILIGVKDMKTTHDRITCIPHMDSDEIKSYYQRAWGYISSSLYESFNQPIIEALSQRCPVVALEKAAIPEQYPFIAQAKNEADLCKKMVDLVCEDKKKMDIKKFEQTFSWKKFVKKLNFIYNREYEKIIEE